MQSQDHIPENLALKQISLLIQEQSKKADSEINQQWEEGEHLLRHTPIHMAQRGAIWQMQRQQRSFVEQLGQMPIRDAISVWLQSLNPGTKRNYTYYINDMLKRNILPENDSTGQPYTVWHFNQVPHEAMIDFIKKVEDWSEGTRQVRAACYISFTAHLERISQGWFRKAMPSKLAANPTFFQVRDKCATKALTLNEWYRFIGALYMVNERDSIIARCMLQGAKRLSEALEVTLEQVEFEKNLIRFRQQKTGGTIKEIPISYPQNFMDELKGYIDATARERKDSKIVFITRTGSKLTRSRFNYSFAKAAEKAKMTKVTPHMLRATWVTLAKKEGIPDTEIMKVTGHTSAKMIYAYDKNSLEDNYSKKLVLI